MLNALAATGNFWESYGMIIILVVFFVLMIVLTIVPQRKQKKQQETMMNSLGPGAKVMTIGGFVGTIVGVDQQNFLVDIGVPGAPQVVTIVKNAIRQRLDVVAPVAVAPEAPVDTVASVDTNTSEVVEDAPAIEAKEEPTFLETEKVAEAEAAPVEEPSVAPKAVKSRKKVERK